MFWYVCMFQSFAFGVGDIFKIVINFGSYHGKAMVWWLVVRKITNEDNV